MRDELPIACSLDAAGLDGRLSDMAKVGRAALIDSRAGEDSAVLRFRAREGIADELGRLVAAESECCPFLDLSLEQRGGVVELTIKGPPEARLTVQDLVAAFSDD